MEIIIFKDLSRGAGYDQLPQGEILFFGVIRIQDESRIQFCVQRGVLAAGL